MKKQILLVAAALLLGMTACQKDEIAPINGNNHENENVLVKSTEDLIGTEWTYTMNLLDSIFIDGGCGWDSIAGLNLQLQFGLNFDSTYAHLTFPEDVTVLSAGEVDGEFSLEEIESLDFGYTYDPTTHTGYLTANTVDEDGNPDTLQIAFTYDTTTDAIVIDLNIVYGFDEDEDVTLQLVFHRNI